MKERPILFSTPMVRAILDGSKTQTQRVVKHKQTPWNPDHIAWDMTTCPYGKAGDRLWVREAFCDARQGSYGRVLYRASGDVCCRWHPSIHMPREISRITLEITDVRVEMLQDISEDDAEAEGIYTAPSCPAYDSFASLWKSINGAESWHENPWVWVVEFHQIDAATSAAVSR